MPINKLLDANGNIIICGSVIRWIDDVPQCGFIETIVGSILVVTNDGGFHGPNIGGQTSVQVDAGKTAVTLI